MASTKSVVCCQEKRFNDRSKMKKRYIKPEVEVIEIENEALMISMSVPDGMVLVMVARPPIRKPTPMVAVVHGVTCGKISISNPTDNQRNIG